MSMNVKVLERVADWLERGAPHEQARGMRFDMMPMIAVTKDTATSENWCGTACCIAGAAITFEDPQLVVKLAKSGHAVYRQDLGDDVLNVWVWEEAIELTGLDKRQASLLFAPGDEDEDDLVGTIPDVDVTAWPFSYQTITPAWAAATIRHLIATGEVRWDLTKPEITA